MRSFNIAICDDEEVMYLAIDNLVKEVFSSRGVGCSTEYFSDPARLAQAYKTKCYDLILLDIEMPGTDGVAFGKALRKYEKESCAGRSADIIYVSNHDERVFDTFMVKPFAFIRKSSILADGRKILGLYIDSASGSENDVVEFKSGSDYFKIPAGEITYVENRAHDQLVHLSGDAETPALHSTLGKIEETLSPHGFIRVHAAYLVNWRYIKKISADEAVLTTGDRVPVSRGRRKEVMSEFLRLSRDSGATGI